MNQIVTLTLIVCVLPVVGLVALSPALVFGRVREHSGRSHWAIATAVVINATAATQLTETLGYALIWLIPAGSFVVGAIVGGIAGQHAWLWGPLTGWWFAIPLIIQKFSRGGPQNFLPVILLLVLPSLVGGIASTLVLAFQRKSM